METKSQEQPLYQSQRQREGRKQFSRVRIVLLVLLILILIASVTLWQLIAMHILQGLVFNVLSIIFVIIGAIFTVIVAVLTAINSNLPFLKSFLLHFSNRPESTIVSTPRNRMIKVLIVIANPLNTEPFLPGTEDRVIHEAIQLSPHRDRISITVRYAATIHDLRRALLADEFQIVHISGHGSMGELLLKDENGRPQVIPQDALADLFRAYSPPIECVILNACYSISQGQLISLGVPFTIAMEGSINNHAAIEFSRGFYDAIGAGRTIDFAYEEGLRTVNFASLRPHFFSQLLTQDKSIRHFFREKEDKYSRPLERGYATIEFSNGFIFVRPSLYQSLRELLDDLYLNYFVDHYKPYSYGSSWILMNSSVTYLIAPWSWLLHANRNKPISSFDETWGTLPPANYGLFADRFYKCVNPPLEEVIGIATNNKKIKQSILQIGDPFFQEAFFSKVFGARILHIIEEYSLKQGKVAGLVSPEEINSNEYKYIILLQIGKYIDGKVILW